MELINLFSYIWEYQCVSVSMKIMSQIKKFTTLALAICLFSVHSNAQLNPASAPAKLNKWNLIQFDFGLGVDTDHYKKMSLNQLMSFAENPNEMQRDLRGLEEDITKKTAGIALYLNLSFAPLEKSSQKYRNNRELRLGVGFHSPKESMVSYKNKDMDTSIVYCNLHGEFTAEAAYLMKWNWGKKKRLNCYVGAGMNASISFSNEMLLIAGKYFEPGAHPSTQENFIENTSQYDAKSVAYTRLFIPYGIHYQLGEQWSIGFDSRRGIGFQSIVGGGSNFITKTGVFALGAKYQIGI
jgi:hypothetical protein